MSSSASGAYQQFGAGHKRGISDMSPTRASAKDETSRPELSAVGGYKNARQSLRSLPQAPVSSPPILKSYIHGENIAEPPKYHYEGPLYSPPAKTPEPKRPSSMMLGRGDSIRALSSNSQRNSHCTDTNPHGPNLSSPDLTTLQKSSTPYLQTLSKFAQSGSGEELAIASPSVAGLVGRRQLKRADSLRASNTSGGSSHSKGSAWSESNWMEKRRQFLQAYEYLCHIGEAKEWIEDVIHKTLPPIVQLEEALRDGVTLAELVQTFYPDQPIRIFRHPKLQFRHSDNIALFFRFLADMELPELFRFELIDLYEKKNIPKVIYCIHALSWLLYRKGIVDFRIGNLVGQLQFEHHELEEMQKGLDKAGISMPSFSGMGASFGAEPEPEPEPVESEEERVARELNEHETLILDLQSQIRGSLIRTGLGDKMQALWDSEQLLIDLQSLVRGKWAREIAEYRLGMERFATDLQSGARGFVVRSRQQAKEKWWRGKEDRVITLQSLVRARKLRMETQRIKTCARRQDSGIRMLQAAIKGTLQRKSIDEQSEEAMRATSDVDSLQAAARGLVQRQKIKEDKRQLEHAAKAIVRLQAGARAIISRRKEARRTRALEDRNAVWITLQSVSRGMILRESIQMRKNKLLDQQKSITTIQASVRGRTLRNQTSKLRSLLMNSQQSILTFQAAARGYLQRRRHLSDLQFLSGHASEISLLQSCVRGGCLRQEQYRINRDLFSSRPKVIQLQALSRAMLARSEASDVLMQLEEYEPAIVKMQAAVRGQQVRVRFAEKQKFFKANMEKVVKVQSFVRAKLQGEAYKSLTTGNNPPVGTVKGFVHLLNDSDFDFDEEVEFERLRKTVVQHVRQNEMADQYITQLDIKIALLVKNKITLDEVVKHQRHFGGDAGRFLTSTENSSKDPFDLKALNKQSRRKLEHYQELFFILQTQPQYLARFFRRVREHATAEKECERIKHLIMGLFGYAQKRREEYYLIKSITRSMKEEIDNSPSVQDYLRGNFFWAKVFAAYIKSPRDRKYMRDILSPLIKENIIDNPEIDLESDPMQIYLSALENEQLRTGRPSERSPDIPREAAIRDPETKRTFITHLQDLRDIADLFFASLEDNLLKMPFGVRYIAQQMFENLSSRFQHEEQGYILQIVGHWIWKSYLQPALVEPDKYGVIDRGLSQEHRRNIGEVSKVVGQAAAGRLFGGENVFLQPLNSYVGESIQRLGEIWGGCEYLRYPSLEH